MLTSGTACRSVFSDKARFAYRAAAAREEAEGAVSHANGSGGGEHLRRGPSNHLRSSRSQALLIFGNLWHVKVRVAMDKR